MKDSINEVSQFSQVKRELLQKLLQEARTSQSSPSASAIHPHPEQEYTPLSSAVSEVILPAPTQLHLPFPTTDVQQAYWLGRNATFELGNVGNHGYTEVEAAGLDMARALSILRKLIERHPMLRAVMLPDGQQQILEQVPLLQVEYIDLEGLGQQEVAEQLAHIRQEMDHQVFQVEQWPAFAIRVSRLYEQRVRIHISIEVLFIDAWSTRILVRDFLHFYHEPEASLPPLDLSFRDYVVAEAQLQASELYRRSQDYWAERLRDLPPAPNLPLASDPASLQHPRFVPRKAQLEASLWQRLKDRGARAGLTPSGILLAAFAEVLTRWSKTPRFCINLTVFDRLPLHPQVNEIVGDFTSLLMLAVDHSLPDTFETHARRLQEQLWRDFDHLYYSGVRVLRDLARMQGIPTQAMMPVVFTSLLGQQTAITSPAPWQEIIYNVTQTPQVWLDHQVLEVDGTLVFYWQTVEALFPSDLLDAMFASYCQLLHRLATGKQSWSERVWHLLPEQQCALFAQANATQSPVSDTLLHTFFLDQAAQCPDQLAIVSPNRLLTYQEVKSGALQLAHYLRQWGVRPNQLVGVMMDKGWEQIVAVLGVLLSGAAYLPIDANLPKERLGYLLENGEVQVVLTQSWINTKMQWPEDLKRVDVDELDLERADICELESVQSPDDLAYVIYTSGSTGVPKGVMIDHRGAVNTILDVNRRFGITSTDRVLALSALNFDLSVYDIFGILAAGGTIVVPNEQTVRDPAAWLTIIEQEQVTIWNTVPALLQLLVEYTEMRSASLCRSGLRLALLSGDWIPLRLPQRLKKLCLDVEVVSLGGATEASIWSILYPVTMIDPSWKSIPYGRPMENQQFFVLGEDLEPCPVWVPGQLYIAGIGLAKGYWRDEEKTQASFFEHPRTGIRLYRTGDLGRYLPDGTIEFLGREDLQVKVQGHRIELGEIEAILAQYPNVAETVVIALGEIQSDKRLAAYVVPKPGYALTAGEMHHFLAERLPGYMVPTSFYLLNALPLTANGKVDRKALVALAPDASVQSLVPEQSMAIASMTGYEPQSALVVQVSQLVAGVLKVERIDPARNLLEYGATSIDLFRIINLLQTQLHVPVDFGRLYNLSNVHAIAAYCEQYLSVGEVLGSVPEPMKENGTEHLSASFTVLMDPIEREHFKNGQLGLRRISKDLPRVQLIGSELEEKRLHKYIERRSHRTFLQSPIPLRQFSDFLGCLQQISLDGKPKYQWGSAGGLYPIQIYVYVKSGGIEGVDEGVYYYHPVAHCLSSITPGVQLERGVFGLVNLHLFDQAAFALFLIGQMNAIKPMYAELSLHFSLIEAGLITQLLEMSAPSHQIALCQTGAIGFKKIEHLFALEEGCVYLHSLLGGALAEYKPEMLTLLSQHQNNAFHKSQAIEVPPLIPSERPQELPLSFAQQRLWFLSQLQPESTAYVYSFVWRLCGSLDTQALEWSLQELICRHESLRTTFTENMGHPLQIIHAPGCYVLPVIDLQGLKQDQREEEIWKLAEQETQRPCDLINGPLLRTSLLRLEEQEHVQLLVAHHIIGDGWSCEIFMHELAVFYQAKVNGEPSPLPPLTIQYADYALWQQQWLQDEVLEEQLAYWRKHLADLSPLALPINHPRPAVQSSRGTVQSLQLSATLSEGLVRLCRQENVTVFMTLLAAFEVLLARYSGQTDIAVGTPIANRRQEEIEGLIGFFVNTLVLRCDLSDHPTFIELLGRVREVCLEAYAHQDIPFEKVVEELQPERDLSHSPLFQVMFELQNVPREQQAWAGVRVIPLAMESTTSKFDLTLSISQTEQGLHCMLEYSTDLFEAQTIRCMLEHWQTLLEGVVHNPQVRVSDVPLLTQAEREQLLVQWNATQTDYPRDLCVHQLFEQQAEHTPDAIALVFEQETLTYDALNRRANHLAHHLQELGIGPERLVGICMQRCIEMVLALLGVLKAGGAYVPLDPTYPAERLAFMMADAGVLALLTHQRLQRSLPESTAQVIALEEVWQRLLCQPDHNPISTVGAHNLAYLIYTSGSTGKPKGAMNTHQGLCNRLCWMQDTYQLISADRVLQKTPLSFDVSVWECFWPLLTGASLIVARPDGHQDPAYLKDLIAQQAITTLHFVPSMLQAFLLEPNLQRCTSLRQVMCSGETLSAELQARFFSHFAQGIHLHNLYGPTEASIDVTFWQCQRESESGRVPIGRPIANTQIYLLDQTGQPTPIGVAGELYIAGVGLARGYFNRPELTAEKFIADPFSQQADARLYRTGDVACYRADGAIEYLGRTDQQVKIRGHRIELGEIEAVLRQHPAIQDCVVLAREDEPADKRLVAYTVMHQAERLMLSDVRSFLQDRLPSSMIPSACVVLDALPLTPNGKLDRRALPRPEQVRPDLEAALVLPRTSTEEVLAAIWCSVLGVEQVGIYDNFFALGGDSIRSIQIVARAREQALHFSLQQLFQQQTIYELAQMVGTEDHSLLAERVQPLSLISSQDQLRLPAGVQDAYPLARLQAGMVFHSQYHPASAVYHDIFSYYLQAPFSLELLRRALQHLAASHPILRTSFDLSTFGEPLQLVHQSVDMPLQVADLSSFSPMEQNEMLSVWLEEEKGRAFDCTQAPLLRFQIHLRSEKSFEFIISFHHAILDGWSVASLFTELFEVYLSLLQGDSASLKVAPAMQFRDFVALEQKVMALEEAKQYWLEKLSQSTSTLLPRWTAPKPSPDNASVHVLPVSISQELSAALKRVARELAVPIKSVLLAVHLRVLSLLSGQGDVLTGLVSNGRPETTDGERILGLFLNTLPFCLKVSGGTWIELIQQTFAAECELLPYRRYPLAEIQRQQGEHTLFETAFNFTHLHVYQNLLNASKNANEFQLLGWAGFEKTNFTLDADFSLDLISSDIRLSLRCNPDELSLEQIEAIGGYYSRALASLAREPRGRYEWQSLLSAKEREQLLVEWNATQTDYPQDICVHQLFEQQVQRTPDAVALVFEEETLTYAQLNGQTNQLARYLREWGVGPDGLVGLYVERSLDAVISIMAVLKAGGAYVPLDPAYPTERLRFMLKEADIPLILAQHHLIEHLAQQRARVIDLDASRSLLLQYDSSNLMGQTQPDHLAYVIFTSGSTGQPKGVLGSHRGILNRLAWMQDTYPLERSERCCQKTSLNFVDAVCEVLAPLLSGVSLTIIPDEKVQDPEFLICVLQTQGITRIVLVPSLLRVLLERDVPLVDDIPCLQVWVSSGEALSGDLYHRFCDHMPTASLLNFYGSSEVAADASWYDASSGDHHAPMIPLGQPIANMCIYVLDREKQLLPIGVAGEVYVGGVGVARGYLRRPELTAERFLPDPFSSKAGERLYRTGDLARYLPHGTIEFLGRVDQQVKLRGYRIELGEIETVLRQHPAIQECVVLAREDIPADQRLVAYAVVHQAERLMLSDVRSYLQDRLPTYMIPSAFVLLDVLPLMPNGKIDRRALPAPEVNQDEELAIQEGAKTPIEELLVGLWSEVLGHEQVGISENFFELGGHSLLAMRLMARLRAMLGVEVPVQALFEASTVAGLAQRVEHALRQGEGMHVPPLVVKTRPEHIPLSFAQQRLWFLDQLQPGSTAYLIPIAQRFSGLLDIHALQQSLQGLLHRHESLRTTFQMRDGHPVQVIHPANRLVVPVIDVQELEQEKREMEARRLARQEQEHPCDLEQGPLLRTAVVRLGSQEHVLLLTLHHIITDGWSSEVLVRELDTLYQAFVAGQSSPLSPLAIQYADYALWQREWLQGEVLQEQLGYWRKQLADLLPLTIPTDHPRPPIQTYRGAMQSHLVPQAVSEGLMRLCQQEHVTLFMLLLAAFQVLLMRSSGQTDIAVGTAIANRNHAGIEGLIGFFVNTLVLRTDLSGNPIFEQVLGQVREVCLGAYAHQDVPFEKVVEDLEPERDLSRSPLFQVMFILQNTPREQTEGILAAVSVEPLAVESMTSKFDLHLSICETEQGLSCALTYNTDLFEAQTIRHLLSHWQVLLEGIITCPQAHVWDVPWLTAGEREQLLLEWNATQMNSQEELCIHQLFERQVEQTPEAIAVMFEQAALTYRDLDARANQLAHWLRSRGVGPEGVVGVCLERSLELVVALLAVLKAGGAYVPLDPSYPLERLAFMMQDAQIRVLLTQSALQAQLPAATVPICCLDTSLSELASLATTRPQSWVGPDNLAYVIYTSGSTGTPKGVLSTHRGVVSYLSSLKSTYPLHGARVLQVTSFSFDPSVRDIFGPLASHGSVVLLTPTEAKDPLAIAKKATTSAVTTILSIVPSMLRELQCVMAETNLSCPTLQILLTNGEALHRSDLAQVQALFDEKVLVVNQYGPTECTMASHSYPISNALNESKEHLPLGHPLPNRTVYILDGYGNPVPIGVPGELHIGGKGLARGYLNRPELTAERFIADPFSQEPNARLYKTGDLARYLPDGNIEFLGRRDQQVKLRGYRIELGEIEAVLRQHPAIQDCVVLAREDELGDKRLVAYLVMQHGQTFTVSDVRSYLQDRLPAYMIPSAFVLLDALPLTLNGKVDRRALPAPSWESSPDDETFLVPRTVVEKELVAIWAEVLHTKEIGTRENFFELGGHSLLATRLMARIRTRFRIEVPLRHLFEGPTIAEMALIIEQKQNELIEQANSEELAQMLAALEGLPE